MNDARVLCGDWNCKNREATQVPVGLDLILMEGDEEDRQDKARRAILCNVHVGGKKRQRYGTVTEYEPLANRPDVVLLAQAYYNRRRDAEQAESDRRAEANRQNALDRWGKAWADEALSPDWVVRDSTTEYQKVNRGVKNIEVLVEGGSSWDTIRIDTIDPTRYNDLPLPLEIRVSSSNVQSPKGALAMALGLTRMAERVAASNAITGNSPTPKRTED